MLSQKIIITIIIILIIISSTTGIIISKIKSSQKSPAVQNTILSIEEVDNLVTNAKNYEASLKITSSGRVISGGVYITADRSQTFYDSKQGTVFSVIDLNKNEMINYNSKNKIGVKIPAKNQDHKNIFKNLPSGAKIINQSEMVNGIDCIVVEIKEGDKTETLWISKKDGIIIKDEINTPFENTIFELDEIQINGVEENSIIIPSEVQIIDITSDDFIPFAQQNPQVSSLVLLPPLPQSNADSIVSVSSSLESVLDQLESTTPTSSDLNLLPEEPREGIYEETSPYLPQNLTPYY